MKGALVGLVRTRGNQVIGGVVPAKRVVIIQELVKRLLKYSAHQILNSFSFNICCGCLLYFKVVG